jgi:hypothetical protein
VQKVGNVRKLRGDDHKERGGGFGKGKGGRKDSFEV